MGEKKEIERKKERRGARPVAVLRTRNVQQFERRSLRRGAVGWGEGGGWCRASLDSARDARASRGVAAWDSMEVRSGQPETNDVTPSAFLFTPAFSILARGLDRCNRLTTKGYTDSTIN